MQQDQSGQPLGEVPSADAPPPLPDGGLPVHPPEGAVPAPEATAPPRDPPVRQDARWGGRTNKPFINIKNLPRPVPPWEGKNCRKHPAMSAVAVCSLCGEALCPTCDFVFPDNMHACPACATAPRNVLSPQKKTALVWSMVLAGVSTLSFAAFMVASAMLVHDGEVDMAEMNVLGLLGMIFILGASIAGFSLAISAKSRFGRTPVSVWVSIAWNGLVGGLFVLLCIVGNLMK